MFKALSEGHNILRLKKTDRKKWGEASLLYKTQKVMCKQKLTIDVGFFKPNPNDLFFFICWRCPSVGLQNWKTELCITLKRKRLHKQIHSFILSIRAVNSTLQALNRLNTASLSQNYTFVLSILSVHGFFKQHFIGVKKNNKIHIYQGQIKTLEVWKKLEKQDNKFVVANVNVLLLPYTWYYLH